MFGVDQLGDCMGDLGVGAPFRYRLETPDGEDLGEGAHPIRIQPGERIDLGNGRLLPVLEVVPFGENDESPFVGVLRVAEPDESAS